MTPIEDCGSVSGVKGWWSLRGVCATHASYYLVKKQLARLSAGYPQPVYTRSPRWRGGLHMFELRAHDGGLTAHSSAFDQDGTPFYIKGVTWRGMEGGEDRRGAELTRTPRRLRWVRTGYAYRPPAFSTYRRRRAACPQGPACCTYWVRVPATGVPYVPRTVRTAHRGTAGAWGGHWERLPRRPAFRRGNPDPNPYP